jgi:hypothetical protein
VDGNTLRSDIRDLGRLSLLEEKLHVLAEFNVDFEDYLKKNVQSIDAELGEYLMESIVLQKDLIKQILKVMGVKK